MYLTFPAIQIMTHNYINHYSRRYRGIGYKSVPDIHPTCIYLVQPFSLTSPRLYYFRTPGARVPDILGVFTHKLAEGPLTNRHHSNLEELSRTEGDQSEQSLWRAQREKIFSTFY